MLTRAVFRRLIYGALHSEIPYWQPSTLQCSRRTRDTGNRAPLPTIPQRSLFGFSGDKSAKTAKSAVLSGYEVLTQLNNQLSQGIRPIPPPDIAEAFKAFFGAKERTSAPLEEVEALQAQGAFEYLNRIGPRTDEVILSSKDLRVALKALMVEPKNGGYGSHLRLATHFYEELERQNAIPSELGKVDDGEVHNTDFARGIAAYVNILSRSGQASKARDLVEKYWESSLKEGRSGPWAEVLKGFISEGNADELSKTVALMTKYDVPFHADIHRAIVTAYAKKGEAEAAKKWYDHPVVDSATSRPGTDAAILELCIQKNEYEWGEKVFRKCLERETPSRKIWGLILKWSAAKGRGVDEIERMMNVMVRRNEGKPGDTHISPDIDMINELVELANSRDDPYTAERYVALGQKWSIQPDARTYLLQLDYRIKIGDLDGARASYSKLQSEETSEDQDVPFVNKLIVALCEKNQPYNHIMSIVEEFSERKASFEPSTVAALARLHLRRSEMEQVDGLLSTHTLSYSLDQRAFIRDVFISFIFDRANNTTSCWEAYRILRTHFPEIPTSIRTSLMTEFFSRKRSDMGTHVFGHMRQSPHRNQRPTSMTYRACFEGIARAGGDVESLQLVHNMLKLDTEIELDTRLFNGLMLAYTASGNPARALEFWEDIVHSKEGPTYSSIQIALQACELAAFGERTARDIWARLQRFGIRVTKDIHAAYVGALAGQAKFQECVDLIEKMEQVTGEKPDTLV